MRLTIPLLLTFALSACAAMKPGFTPDSQSKTPAQFQPFNGGKVDQSGRYVVTAEERALSCPKITGSMQIIISRLKDSPTRPKSSSATRSMQAVAKPIVGQGANLDIDEENRQSHARLKAYNELLAEKKCKTLDLAGV